MFRVLLVLLVCGHAGCSSLTNPKSSDLAGVVKRFHHDLRWKYHEDAAARVNPEFRADFRDQLEELDRDLNITAWDIRKVELDPEKKQAVIRVNLRYFKMPSTVVQDEKVEQVWKRLGDHWILMELEGGPLVFPPKQDEDPKDE